MKRTQFQETLLAKATETGFTEAEIYYERSESFKCMIFEGEIDSYETSEQGGIGFRGLYDGKMGYAYSEKIEDASIPFLIDSAKANAEVLDEDDGTDIFEGSDSYNEQSFYSEALATITTEAKIDFIKQVEEKTLAYDKRITALNRCAIQDFSSELMLANTKGLTLSDKMNGLVVFVSAVVKDGEEMKTSSVFKLTRDFNTLDADEIAKEVAEEALSNLGEQSIPSGKYAVIMRNDAATSLMATFSPIFSAENTQKDQSLLKGKVGAVIASKFFKLADDPFHPASVIGANFDGEGVATKKHVIIENGKLATLLHNRKTAKIDGVETTGHAQKSSYKSTLTVSPNNLYVEPGDKSRDELVVSMQEGVLITGLSGLHSGASTISGDFSVAATGFYIKDGKISTPVKQMTIAGNFFDYMKNVEEAGADLEFFSGGYGSPSLRIKELSITVE